AREHFRVVPIPVFNPTKTPTTACIFWLKNRQRDLWRDRVDATAKVVRDVVTMTDDELIDIIRPTQASMPIRQGGRLANRVSTCLPCCLLLVQRTSAPRTWL